MTKFVGGLLTAALLATSATVLAAGSQESLAAGSQEGRLAAGSGEEKADMDRVICRRDSVVGSRVQKRRTCMTRREWINLHDGTRNGMDQFLKQSTAGAPRGS